MAQWALVSQESVSTPTSTLSRADLEWHVEEWLVHCEGRHAASTAETRCVFLKNFLCPVMKSVALAL